MSWNKKLLNGFLLVGKAGLAKQPQAVVYLPFWLNLDVKLSSFQLILLII